jgi:thioredoxin 1
MTSERWQKEWAAVDPGRLTRADVERVPGFVLLEFGASWCPHCQRLAPELERLLSDHPEVFHIRVEDGPGRPLGRSFGVKLWPNLVMLQDGHVIAQLARPDCDQIRDVLENLSSQGGATS